MHVNITRDDFENIEEAWKGDLWNRKPLGEQLTKYVDRLQCGAVLALDARWGEGKTWFVRHWAKHLTDTNHNVIYLDAFANDYLDDPFLVIASEIANKLDKTADKKLVHKFKKASAVMQQGLLTLSPTLIASMISFAITGGIIPFLKIDSDSIKDKIDDAIDGVAENIGEKVTEAIQNKIDSYEEEKQSLLAFKNTLTKLAESLDQPLVFIIDELDRCRPDFAIRLIERIKHFFDIRKIVFVLVMNKPQLLQLVKSYYGYDSELNGDYLEKFIDFTIKLPASNDNKIYENIIKENLLRIGEIENKDQVNEIYFLLLGLQWIKKCNARELIKLINRYSLLKTQSMEKNIILLSLLFYPDSNYKFRFNEIITQLYTYWGGEVSHDNTHKQVIVAQRLKDEFNLELIYFINYINMITSFESSQYNDNLLTQRMEIYSITELKQSNEFILNWKNYIDSSFLIDD